jgi:serine/threonine-protein kinase
MSFFCIHCRSEIDPKFKACPHCGEAITDFLRRHLETPIDGKYQILGRLGVGGMGEVYKALHIHLNAIRVIKLMRANIAGDPGAHERFLREARLATRIHHPNVAALYDFSTLEDDARYMVWEHIEGINLHELIETRGPLSPKYAGRIASQALMGLDAIHRAGIVHRDVSPENIMISHDEDGEEHVKIIDLGIAKQWDDGDNKTKTGMFVGKWKYCSPEHLGMLGEGERIDGRADLYSFGIVLYEMLTGVPPFQADTPHKYLMMHSSGKARPLREVNPSVTAPLQMESLIFRALEKDRNKRFATAREFAKALDELQPGLDDTPGKPAPLPVAIEITDAATRAMPGPVRDQPTMFSKTLDVDPHAVTVPESKPSPARKQSPAGAPAPHAPRPALRRSGRRFGWTVGALTAVVVGVIVAIMSRPGVPPESAAVAVTTANARVTSASVLDPSARRLAAAAVPNAGHVAVNAFPWGEVTKIAGADGKPVAMESKLVTPAVIDLAPGRYDLTFSNPAFAAPITRSVEIRGGEEQTLAVQFADPKNAKLPAFDGAGR